MSLWLFRAGGYDGSNFLTTIEKYDPDTNEWTEETSMSCGRSGHGVAVTLEPCIKYVSSSCCDI